MNMRFIIMVIVLIFSALIGGCVNKNSDNISSADPEQKKELPLDIEIEDRFIPASFDKYYKTQPSEYLLKMYELSSSMENVIIDLQDGNVSRAKDSFEIFSKNYRNSSKMVNDWTGYYDNSEIDDLGKAIKSGNISESFEMMDLVREACTDCHREIRYVVWATYNWKDFEDIKMNTTDKNKPMKSWIIAKTKYLSPGYEGIGIGIKNGNNEQAIKSFKIFKEMFINMKDACTSCHLSEPKYYVSGDVISMMENMEKQLTSGNLNKAEKIRLDIGVECRKCHIIHEPLQRIKELEK